MWSPEGRCSRGVWAPSCLTHVCGFKAPGCRHTLLIRPRALRCYLTMSRTTCNSELQLADLMRHRNRLQNRNQQMHLFIIYTQPDILQREISPTLSNEIHFHMWEKKNRTDKYINAARSGTSGSPKGQGWIRVQSGLSTGRVPHSHQLNMNLVINQHLQKYKINIK